MSFSFDSEPIGWEDGCRIAKDPALPKKQGHGRLDRAQCPQRF